MSVLGSLHADCAMGCNRWVRADNYMQHIESQCQHHFVQSTLSPSHTTIRDILTKSSQAPTTPAERKVAGNVIRRIMTESADTALIKIPTPGLVSEGKQRALAATVTGDNLRAELGAFSISHTNGDEIREVPFVYVPNLIAKVADMVSTYERYKNI